MQQQQPQQSTQRKQKRVIRYVEDVASQATASQVDVVVPVSNATVAKQPPQVAVQQPAVAASVSDGGAKPPRAKRPKAQNATESVVAADEKTKPRLVQTKSAATSGDTLHAPAQQSHQHHHATHVHPQHPVDPQAVARGHGSFSGLALVAELSQAVISAFPSFTDKMTEIQSKTIPVLISKDVDICARASTGSGKTLAFLLPCLDFLCKRASVPPQPQVRTCGALVLAPTRELALQISEVAEKIISALSMKRFGIRLVTTIGGGNMNTDKKKLDAGCDLLIATPGRVLDHLQSGVLAVNQQTFRFLVLDEADQLLLTGFEHDLKKIVALLPKQRSTLLFSATLEGKKMKELSAISLRHDKLVSVGVEVASDANGDAPAKRNVSTLVQQYVVVPAERKLASLISIVKANPDLKIIIFVSVKSEVKFVSWLLEKHGISNQPLHGSMNQTKRTRIFFEFMQQSTSGVLIATDIAARGLDFPNIDLVLQCDLPDDLSQYFHRAGRTARAGKDGVALLLLTQQEVVSCLDKLKNELKESPSDTAEHITQVFLAADQIKQLETIQASIFGSVQGDAEMLKFAQGIPKQLNKVYDMHAAPKLGLPKGQFQKRAVQICLGLIK